LNKTKLIEHIAIAADLPKVTAAKALDAMLGAITTSLKNDDSVTLVGFGTFSVAQRKERSGRDPRTKETIQIKASKLPRFKPGKALKDAVN
jgi:DNA-binding protein HU-beta